MKNKPPIGWSEDKIKSVIDHHEFQSEDGAIAEKRRLLLKKRSGRRLLNSVQMCVL